MRWLWGALGLALLGLIGDGAAAHPEAACACDRYLDPLPAAVERYRMPRPRLPGEEAPKIVLTAHELRLILHDYRRMFKGQE